MPSDPVAAAVRKYNEAAQQAGWPEVQKMNPARSKHLKARLVEVDGLDGCCHAVDRALRCRRPRMPVGSPKVSFGTCSMQRSGPVAVRRPHRANIRGAEVGSWLSSRMYPQRHARPFRAALCAWPKSSKPLPYDDAKSSSCGGFQLGDWQLTHR